MYEDSKPAVEQLCDSRKHSEANDLFDFRMNVWKWHNQEFSILNSIPKAVSIAEAS